MAKMAFWWWLERIRAEIWQPIINLVPSNGLQKDYDGDTKTLPYFGDWESILRKEGLYFFLNSEDLRSAVYLFELPKVGGRYSLLTWQEHGWRVGRQEELIMLTCNVIPMSWKLAVGIVQHCMKELVRRYEVMPAELELRRDRPPPVDEDFFV